MALRGEIGACVYPPLDWVDWIGGVKEGGLKEGETGQLIHDDTNHLRPLNSKANRPPRVPAHAHRRGIHLIVLPQGLRQPGRPRTRQA